MVELVDLGKLGEVVHAVATSVGKLAESIAKAVRLAAQGHDAVVVRLERAQLKGISRKAVRVSVGNLLLRGAITDLLDVAKYEHADADERKKLWQRCLFQCDKSLEDVEVLLHDLKSEDSDFVFGVAYSDMVSGLEVRRRLILSIREQPPPETKRKLDELSKALREFSRLRRELLLTRALLAGFVVRGSVEHRKSINRGSSSTSTGKRRQPKRKRAVQKS